MPENDHTSSMALVASYEDLHAGFLRFMALEQGTPAEQKFFRDRIKNTKRFVAVANSGGSFDFCPGAYVAFHDRKTLEQWEALGEKVYRGRGRAYLSQYTSTAEPLYSTPPIDIWRPSKPSTRMPRGSLM